MEPEPNLKSEPNLKPELGKNKLFNNNKNKDGGSNQKLILFIRGNAISGDPDIKGNKKFPNPPIIKGITIKKIIKKAWLVIIEL